MELLHKHLGRMTIFYRSLSRGGAKGGVRLCGLPNSSEMENDSVVESRELCDLAEGYSFILQSVLGVLAFSTLICKLLVSSDLITCDGG